MVAASNSSSHADYLNPMPIIEGISGYEVPQCIVGIIMQYLGQGYEPGDISVLCASNSSLYRVEEQLIVHKIPHQMIDK